jgi:hypothetical protein
MPFPLEYEEINDHHHEHYKDQIDHFITHYVNAFERVLKSFTLFNAVFILLIVAEIGYFVVHLTFLAQSFIIAIHLAFLQQFFVTSHFKCMPKQESQINSMH